MTASDIVRIISTVGVIQGICDIMAQKFVFTKQPYLKSIATLERSRTKRDKTLSATSNEKISAKSAEKNAKKIQRAQDEYAEACADVAKRHTFPGLATSIVFVILYRILSMEYSGKIIAVLPFQPWSLVRRFTLRGIVIDPAIFTVPPLAADGTIPRVSNSTQACAFLFVYILSTLSVKYAVHKLVGKTAPTGADKGISTMLDDPKSQKFLRGLGVDTMELNEAKKMW